MLLWSGLDFEMTHVHLLSFSGIIIVVSWLNFQEDFTFEIIHRQYGYAHSESISINNYSHWTRHFEFFNWFREFNLKVHFFEWIRA